MSNVGLLDVAQQVYESGVTFRQSDVPAVVEGQPSRLVDVSVVRLPGDAVAMVFDDVTEERRALSQLRHQAQHDGLTGLLNRSTFRAELDELVDRSVPVTVLLMDLDGFKEINDGLGHKAGDDILVEFAAMLRAEVDGHEGALVCRLGGDEFAIAVPGAIDAGVAVAERIGEALQAPVAGAGPRGAVLGCSIGVAAFPRHASRAAELLRAADVAMYAAKSGRSSVSIAGVGTTLTSVDLSRRLDRALADDRFLFHAQPIVDLATGLIVGVEGLARWVEPGDSVLLPGSFLELLRVAGRLPELTRTMLAQAQPLLDGPRFVALNVCEQDLDDETTMSAIAAADALPATARRGLWLEVAETRMAETGLERLQAISTTGRRLAIDDFGVGHSSLSRLQQLAVDVVKLDRLLVSSPGSRADVVLESVVSLSHDLGASVVAEGIETARCVEQVTAVGCDLGQGYYFGHPVPLPLVAERLLDPAAFHHRDWPRP